MTVQRQILLNGKILCKKAHPIAKKTGHTNFRATERWFSGWKARNGIVFTKPVDEAAEADVDTARHFVADVLPEILRRYAPSNIFNANETGIYFRSLPSTTFIKKKYKKGTKGFKTAKDRITCLGTCTMNGGKKDLLLIDKSKETQCFQRVKELLMLYELFSNV